MRKSIKQHFLTVYFSIGLAFAWSYSQSAAAAAPGDLQAYQVGSLPGQLSVEQGVANYSIPIGVPPGVAGVEPELALTYSSMGGAGYMGLGWSLSGFSAITRCSRTLVQDDAVTGIEWRRDDRYCLDGQRLILVSGVYGENGSEYRTELDGFSRIRAYGSAGEGPAKFKVETKAGQTIEYGYTEDSRIEAHGRTEAVAWALNKLTDAVGNSLKIHYYEEEEHTEYYPKDVLYSGNRIAFGYVDLPSSDSKPKYLSSVKFRATRRLHNINVNSDGQLVTKYKFTYDSRPDEPDLLETANS